jgi:type 1 glutamine amidotransferase
MKRFIRSLAAATLAVGLVLLPPSSPLRAADAPAKAAEPAAGKRIKVLLVTGGCCHDYGRQKQILQKGLSERAPIDMTIVHEGDGITSQRHSIYENPDWWKGFDLVIHDECSADVKDTKFIENILAAHKAGIPAVVLHCGMHNYRSEGFPKDTPWFQFTGLHTTGHGPQEAIELTYLDQQNPITKGLANWTTVKEELYNNITGNVEATATPLIRGKQMVKGKPVETIVAWTNVYDGKTKVFATTVGHNNETVGDARYLNLVARGMLWTLGRLDDFKASDQNVDVKAIPDDPHPGKKPEKKVSAPGAVEVKDVKCCGAEE